MEAAAAAVSAAYDGGASSRAGSANGAEGGGGGGGERLYDLVVGELQLVMTVMRLNRRWQTDPRDFTLQYRGSLLEGDEGGGAGGRGAASAGAGDDGGGSGADRGAEALSGRARSLRLIRGLEVLRRSLTRRNVSATLDRLQVGAVLSVCSALSAARSTLNTHIQTHACTLTDTSVLCPPSLCCKLRYRHCCLSYVATRLPLPVVCAAHPLV